MVNIIHLIVLLTGILAYVFSDVNSSSGFNNTFLPFVVLLSFIYGVVVTINIIYKARNKSREQDRSADILLANLKGKLPEQNNNPETDISVNISSAVSYNKQNENKQNETLIETAEVEIDVTGFKYTAGDLTEGGDLTEDGVLTQDELNQQEWDNPDNWGGTSWLEFYFSKNDSRTWVPKRIPLLGKTLNLAKHDSAYWITGIVVMLVGLGILVVFL